MNGKKRRNEVNVQEKMNYALIQIIGECEADLANELQLKINNLRTDNRVNNFVIDFARVTHLSSTALSVLVVLKRLLEKTGNLYFVNPSDYILKIIRVIDVENNFKILDSVEDAEKIFSK